MSWNVPEDWHCYYNSCSHHGIRWHASEGPYCPICLEEDEEQSEEQSDEDTEESTEDEE